MEQTINICEVSEVTAQSGYISSPSYPLNYNKPYQCQISIDLRTKQKIRLVIVDMNLHENESGKGCTDYLYIRNELRSVTVCGQRGSEELFDSSGKIDIRFAAEAGGDNKGFWLYYEGTSLILDCLLLTWNNFCKAMLVVLLIRPPKSNVIHKKCYSSLLYDLSNGLTSHHFVLQICVKRQ